MNRHDPEGMAATMTPDYRSDQPVHPNRHFVGNRQVVANWTEMFRGVPDLVSELLAEATEGRTSLAEWRGGGHPPGGPRVTMWGVPLAGVGDGGALGWERLYVEPVEQGSAAIEEAVRQLSS